MRDAPPDGDTAPRSRRSPGALEVVAGIAVVAGLGIVGYSVLTHSDGGAATAPTSGADSSVNGLNVSCFAYRDVNRDGVYDVDDRPYAALLVQGSGPNGTTTAVSNTAGFTNFKMLLDGESAFVDRAGTYEFEALPPEGWTVTSGPTSQTVEFDELDGSPVGVVASTQCEPFGVAPQLMLEGPLPPSGADGGDAVELVSIESVDGSVQAEPRAIEDGRFAASVDSGPWLLTIDDGDGGRTRRVEVRHDPVFVSQQIDDQDDLDPMPTSVVVGFDDFTTAKTLAEIPNGYGGLNWSNWVATHRILYGGPGYVNVATSGEYVAYNSSGNPATVSSDQPFDFVGASIGSAWPEGERYDVVIRAWRGEELVHTDRLSPATAGPVFFDADYRNITRLEMASEANWQFVVDDAEFRVAG